MGPSVGVVTTRGSRVRQRLEAHAAKQDGSERAQLVFAEPLAQAHARSPTERHVGAARKRGLALGQEPVRVKPERVRVQLGR